MKKSKKIPLSEVQKRLQAIMQYKKTDIAFDALFRCWIRHPRFKSPAAQTMRIRLNMDGEMWLKEEEIASFSDYCGVKLG